jgi:hypothetical protein
MSVRWARAQCQLRRRRFPHRLPPPHAVRHANPAIAASPSINLNTRRMEAFQVTGRCISNSHSLVILLASCYITSQKLCAVERSAEGDLSLHAGNHRRNHGAGLTDRTNAALAARRAQQLRAPRSSYVQLKDRWHSPEYYPWPLACGRNQEQSHPG